MKTQIEIGEVFGKLKVIGRAGKGLSGHTVFHCQCECGKSSIVTGSRLRSEHTKSCGCLKGEQHGLRGTPEYDAWSGAKDRCHNPKSRVYLDYGGRGIIMDVSWRNSFLKFFSDLGPRPSVKHSLDRENTNGNYEPGNCRWATRKEQLFNRRPTTSIKYFSDQELLNEAERRGLVI